MRAITYALAISLFCGMIGLLEPLDDRMRDFRYLARDVSADGSIVVVGIDQASIDALGGEWPWSRAHYAKIISRLKEAGANRIVFDKSLSNKNSVRDDNSFIEITKRYQGSVYLGVGLGEIGSSAPDGFIRPFPTITKYVGEIGYKVRFNPLGQVDQVYTTLADGARTLPSISVLLSGRNGLAPQLVRPDFSIRSQTFPYIRASDLVLGKPISTDVRGKDVLLGDAALSLGDMKFLPGHFGQQAGLYVHAIAAQTLKTGVPINLDWFPPWGFAVAASIVIVFARTRLWQIVTMAVFPAAILLVPIFLDSKHISVEISPAILMFMIAAIQNARIRLGWQKSRVNENSGLANIVALRELKSRPETAVIAAKIENYAAITASFPRDIEKGIAGEIVGRLRLRDEGLTIYQADDGVFYWIASIVRPAELGNHLEGLKALFASAMQIGDRRVDVAISFGADLDTERPVASRAGSALLCAEEALRTGQRWKLYDPKRTADAAWQLSLASEIDRGMADGEFWLAYQPKLNLKTGRMTGGEVLLRWRHPERGEISPAEFIPAAERSQRIGSLTDYVIQRTLASAQLLAADGDFKLAVNVSVPVLGDPNFAQLLLMKCEGAGVNPKRIVIEITESVLMSADDAQVESTLAQLRACGFGLSIDDFGTGFSSLEYVRRIPAHEMKIDQSFVRRVLKSQADRVVVESVLRMAHELGRRVVAEGVEDAATLDLLRELGCDEVQGYHIGRPVDFTAFRAALVSSNRAAA